jgi:hypothetical protein
MSALAVTVLNTKIVVIATQIINTGIGRGNHPSG